jgi:ribonuclease E
MLRKSLAGGAVVWLALAAVTWGQDAPPPAADPAPAAAPPANEAVGQFDSNGDGQLLGQELDRARNFLRALRGVVGDRPREARAPREGDGERPMRERGGRGGGRGERGRRGDGPPAGEAPPFEIGDGEGPPRPQGPRDGEQDGGPPRQRPDQTARLFREFDDNEDGQLNRDEFTALMGALRERRGPGAAAGPPEGEAIGPPDGREGRRRDGGEGPPRGRRGGGDNGPPRREGRLPRDGEVGQAFHPGAPLEVA